MLLRICTVHFVCCCYQRGEKHSHMFCIQTSCISLISPLYIIKMKWAVCRAASRIWGKGWEGGTQKSAGKNTSVQAREFTQALNCKSKIEITALTLGVTIPTRRIGSAFSPMAGLAPDLLRALAQPLFHSTGVLLLPEEINANADLASSSRKQQIISRRLGMKVRGEGGY